VLPLSAGTTPLDELLKLRILRFKKTFQSSMPPKHYYYQPVLYNFIVSLMQSSFNIYYFIRHAILFKYILASRKDR